VLLVVMAAAGSSILSTSLYRQASARGAKQAEQAVLIAEGGLDRSFYELQMGEDFGGDAIGVAGGELGEGDFTTTLTPDYDGAGQYRIRSVGDVRGVRRAVEAVIVLAPSVKAVFGRDGVTLSGGSLVDSYDSGAGSYASQLGTDPYAGTEGTVQSNGDIRLVGTVVVTGDAKPGPTGTISGDTSNVLGSTAPLTDPIVFDPYTYKPPVASSGPLNSTTALGTGVYRYDELGLNSSEELVIHGDVVMYVDGLVSVTAQARILITPGASLQLHHGSGDVKLSGKGVLNTSEIPSNFNLYSATTDDVSYSGSSALHGVVYAPEANCGLSGTAGMYGAFVGRELTVSGGADIHYDSGLDVPGANGFEILIIRPVVP
jgi:hypothetical protein